MENAPEPVKLAADFITSHVDSGGVSDFIELLINGEF